MPRISISAPHERGVLPEVSYCVFTCCTSPLIRLILYKSAVIERISIVVLLVSLISNIQAQVLFVSKPRFSSHKRLKGDAL